MERSLPHKWPEIWKTVMSFSERFSELVMFSTGSFSGISAWNNIYRNNGKAHLKKWEMFVTAGCTESWYLPRFLLAVETPLNFSFTFQDCGRFKDDSSADQYRRRTAVLLVLNKVTIPVTSQNRRLIKRAGRVKFENGIDLSGARLVCLGCDDSVALKLYGSHYNGILNPDPIKRASNIYIDDCLLSIISIIVIIQDDVVSDESKYESINRPIQIAVNNHSDNTAALRTESAILRSLHTNRCFLGKAHAS
ncbi:predicted protein [Sclerotinia sclerotiorum 1980 UF-70]|uniref:Uncharacterized protein n=1 Tax=Sclerotinia sclerotiorum (strain ATCC 18683 / 1980 / Ss-1) TaxID=665079 RepID=A7F910_SCLS1|nr:predicted protein [Sclerotinia sclerotiorum 1980 UF-70]EDN99231.1 predicted protein [Sclerotinia sclerotiorum 1980 UF-70]